MKTKKNDISFLKVKGTRGGTRVGGRGVGAKWAGPEWKRRPMGGRFVERRDFGLFASVTAMDLRPFDELSFN